MANIDIVRQPDAVPAWVAARGAHLASLSISGPADVDRAGRVFDFHRMTPTSTARTLERIYASNAMIESAKSSTTTELQSVSAPFEAADNTVVSPAEAASSPVVITGAKPIGFDKGLGSPGPTTKEESDRRQAEIDAHDQQVRENNKKPPTEVPPPVVTPPAVQPNATTPAEQTYLGPGANSPGSTTSVPSSLAELGVPSATPDKNPPPPGNPVPANQGQQENRAPTAFEQMYGGLDGSSPSPVATTVPTLAELAMPGYKEPSPVTVSADCTTTVSSTPGVVPTSITNPTTTFRTGTNYANGFSYTPEQLAADMATVRRGPVQWVGPGDPYQDAYARLSAAQYTVEEQRIDLLWAQYNAKTDEARAQQLAALIRLRQAGIPWRDPAIEKFVSDRENIPVSTDPDAPARWIAPPKYTPAQLRQQLIDANRTDTTIRELVNNSIDDMFIDPATVLWQAAHGEGDHSGWEITWAAAKLGVNVVLTVPGPGAAAAAGAKALIRNAAPKLWETLTGAETAAQATRIGSEFQTKQLLDDLTAYQRTRIPPPHAGAPNSPRLELPPIHPDAAPKISSTAKPRAESDYSATVDVKEPSVEARPTSEIVNEIDVLETPLAEPRGGPTRLSNTGSGNSGQNPSGLPRLPQRRVPGAAPVPATIDLARTAEEVEAYLVDRHGLSVFGFTEPGLPVEPLAEYARAFDDVVARYPDITLPRIVGIADEGPGSTAYASTGSLEQPDGTWVTHTLMLNREFAISPERMRIAIEHDMSLRYHPPGHEQRPYYAVTVHELGHVLDDQGRRLASATAEKELKDYFIRNVPHSKDPAQLDAEFADWTGALSRYSFLKNDPTKLNPDEALAEAFVEVEMNGANASEPAKVLHRLLVESRRQQ
ncbi:hypothetical protein ACIA8C_11715 [Nocardia sp. NPDC051321]|uniref:hypothetical protein n=1 Tax=Nocardia sp. NPDC051321 TaxID=3364323 RepID=UPI00379F3B40